MGLDSLKNIATRLISRRSVANACEKHRLFAKIATCSKFTTDPSLGKPCFVCRGKGVFVSYSFSRYPTVCVSNAEYDMVLLAHYLLYCAESMLFPATLVATVTMLPNEFVEERKASKLVRKLSKYSNYLLEAIELLPQELPPLIAVKDGELVYRTSSLVECPLRYVLLIAKKVVREEESEEKEGSESTEEIAEKSDEERREKEVRYFVFFVGRRARK